MWDWDQGISTVLCSLERDANMKGLDRNTDETCLSLWEKSTEDKKDETNF